MRMPLPHSMRNRTRRRSPPQCFGERARHHFACPYQDQRLGHRFRASTVLPESGHVDAYDSEADRRSLTARIEAPGNDAIMGTSESQISGRRSRGRQAGSRRRDCRKSHRRRRRKRSTMEARTRIRPAVLLDVIKSLSSALSLRPVLGLAISTKIVYASALTRKSVYRLTNEIKTALER